MNRFDAPESIFAPLVAAVPAGTSWCGFDYALMAAAHGIPIAVMSYTVRRPGKFKKELERREQLVVSSDKGADPFTSRARLVERVRGAATPSDVAANLWEVGVTNLKDGLCAPAVPEDWDSGMLEVPLFRFAVAGINGGAQLALLRHRFASTVLAASPDAIVFGGQYHWDDDWWTEQVTQPQEA